MRVEVVVVHRSPPGMLVPYTFGFISMGPHWMNGHSCSSNGKAERWLSLSSP